MMKANKQIGFIYKNNESIDKIIQNGEVVFERGFLREKTSTTLPITFGGVGKNLKDYRIYGNTYQESYSGKNLFDYITHFNPSINGMQNTLSEDGTITIKGIPTTNYTQIVAKYDITDVLEDGETYRLSMTNNQQYFWFEVIGRINGTNKIYYTSREYSGSKNTVVVDKSTYDSYVVYAVTATTSNWGTSSRTVSTKFQLEKGNTKTEFEKYVGGYPSPNPDYPSKIISIGEKSKNQFDKNNYKFINGYLDGSSKLVSSSTYCVYIKCKSNTTYTVSKTQLFDNDRFCVFDMAEEPQINDYALSFVGTRSGINTQTSLTLRTNNTANYLCVFLKAGNNPNATLGEILETIQIEENSIATPYESYYDGYKIPINIGTANLVDNTLQSQTKNGITLTKNLDGSITANGTATANAFFDVGKFIQKHGVAYTLNGCPKGGGGSKYRLYLLGETTPYFDDGEGVDFPIINVDTQRTLRLAIYNNMTVENLTFYPMVRLTEIQNCEYQPYYNETTNIYLDKPLRKMGNYTDYIDFKRSKIIRNIGEKKLDDTIQWTTGDFNAQKRLYCASNKIDSNMQKVYSNSHKGILMADQYPADTLENILANNIINAVGISSSSYFSIMNQKYASAYEFLQALQAKPVLLLYGLINSVEEDIELPNIPTLDGNNTLNIETEITPSQVYIKYKSNS